MEIKEKVEKIIWELSPQDSINLDDKLQDDLGLDSLSMVMLLMEIEDEFGIEIDESDMNPYDLITVADAVDLIKKYVGDNYE